MSATLTRRASVVIEPMERRMLMSAAPTVLPPHATVAGKTLGEWTAAWWQWAGAISTRKNPILDTTGQNADINQDGPVYFLAGSQGNTVQRNVTIPANKYVFIPVVNNIWVTLDTDPPHTLEELRELFTRPPIDDAQNVSAQIDGAAVSNVLSHREEDPSGFFVNWPRDNIFDYPPLPDQAGVCVNDGYWLMVAPMSAGNHDLHFTAQLPDFPGFDLDVTYHLKVAGRKDAAAATTTTPPRNPFADPQTIGNDLIRDMRTDLSVLA